MSLALIADRFVRDARGRLFDLATAEEIRLVEPTVAAGAPRAAWRDACQRLLDVWQSDRASLIDYIEIGDTRCLEVYAARTHDDERRQNRTSGLCAVGTDVNGGSDVGDGSSGSSSGGGGGNASGGRGRSASGANSSRSSSSRSAGSRSGGSGDAASVPADDAARNASQPAARAIAIRLLSRAASGGVCAALDEERLGQMKRLYVRAPPGAGLTTWFALIAREARRRGFVPLCPAALVRWPDLIAMVRGRSVVLLCDRRDEAHDWRDLSVSLALQTLARVRSRVDAVIWAIDDRIASLPTAPPAFELGPLPVRALAQAVTIAMADSQIDTRVDTPSRRATGAATGGDAEALDAIHEAAAREAEGLPGRYVARLLGRESLAGASTAAAPAAATVAALTEASPHASTAASSTSASFGKGAPEGQGLRRAAEAAARYRVDALRASAPASASALVSVSVSVPVPVPVPALAPGLALAQPPRMLLAGMTSRRASIHGTSTRSQAGHFRADMVIADAWNLLGRHGHVIRDADALVARGRWAAAIRTLRAHVAAQQRRGAAQSAAVAALALARLHLMRCEIAEAERWSREAGELAAGVPDDVLAADALHWSGLIALEQADLESSDRWLRMALIVAEEQGDEVMRQQIEVSLARSLFWQGCASQMSSACARAQDERLPAAIRLRARRLAVRRHLARGELSDAGGELTAATALLDDLDPGLDAHERREWTCALHIDRARLQLAIGDREGAGRHFGMALTARPTAARLARIRLLQIESFRLDRTEEARRRVSRLTRVFLQARMPRLLRLRARYWIEPASRRSAELARFIDRYGEVALAGRPVGTQGPLSASQFRSLLHMSHEHGDERTALARICSFVRDQVEASYVAVHGTIPAGGQPLLACAGQTRLASPTFVRRIADIGLSVAPMVAADAIEAGTPVQAHGQTIGVLVCRWIIDRTIDRPLVAMLLPAAADAAAPHVQAVLDRAGFLDVSLTRSPRTDGAIDANTDAGFDASASLAVGASPHVRAGIGSGATGSADASASASRRADSGGGAAARANANGSADGAAGARSGASASASSMSASSMTGVGGNAGGSARASSSSGASASGASRMTSVSGMTGGIASGRNDAGVNSRLRPSPSTQVSMLGDSAPIVAVREAIARAADAPFHVLIEGESGSGKELVARALHQHSLRRIRKFCAVNCAALSDDLLEAELFGHARGAFTGALAERVGLFEEAHEGTLFLDEVGELSPRAQAKLLRAIQDGEIRRVGENLPRRVHPRIVAATNRTLRDEAAAGRFRPDLLYRLDVVRIAVPPLRERVEDVPVLARAFWQQALSRTGSRATLDPETLAALARYDWPGNVRELQNVIARLAVQAPARGRVDPAALPPPMRPSAPQPSALPLDRARRAFEEQFVRAALARAGGHAGRAARDLGVTRQGLSKLLARLGLTAADDPGG
jgi:DNA-binding NtrC family response regulator